MPKTEFLKRFLLLLLFALEVLSFGYLQVVPEMYSATTWIWFVSGLLIALFPFLTRPGNSSAQHKLPVVVFTTLVFGVWVALLAYYLRDITQVFSVVHIDKNWSDVLPTIQVACQRFLRGEPVYAPAPEIWPNAIIPYMPSFWFPFVPAFVFGFDMRWVTVFFAFVSLLLSFAYVCKARNWQQQFLCILMLFITHLFFNFQIRQYSIIWSMSQEYVAVAYYLFLGWALLRKWHPAVLALAISFCLLSRFSGLMWVGFYLLYLFIFDRAYAVRCVLFLAAYLTAFFIVPFFISNPRYFLQIGDSYRLGVDYHWTQGILTKAQYTSLGFYKCFDSANYHWLLRLQLLFAILMPPGILYAMHRCIKSRPQLKPYIGISSLKVSLIFFYAFVPLPFLYLFMVPVLLSLPLILTYICE